MSKLSYISKLHIIAEEAAEALAEKQLGFAVFQCFNHSPEGQPILIRAGETGIIEENGASDENLHFFHGESLNVSENPRIKLIDRTINGGRLKGRDRVFLMCSMSLVNDSAAS